MPHPVPKLGAGERFALIGQASHRRRVGVAPAVANAPILDWDVLVRQGLKRASGSRCPGVVSSVGVGAAPAIPADFRLGEDPGNASG